MKFENAGIAGKVVQFSDLEHVMKTLEIIRGGQWDWERVTYDHKFENRSTGDIHYLRVQGVATKGEIENPDAVITLKTPILGHYYYPHGIEYDEEMPTVIVDNCNDKLAQLKELLEEVELAESEPLNIEDITQKLLQLQGVENVADLHSWEEEAGQPALSCHLLINGGDPHAIVNEASAMLRDNFNIEKSTIQIDRAHKVAEKKN